MSKLKELYEERAAVAVQMRELTDSIKEDRDWTDEENDKWSQMTADYDGFADKIDAEEGKVERANKLRQIEEQQEEAAKRSKQHPGRDIQPQERKTPGPTEEHRALALQAFARHGTGIGITDEHREACRMVGIDPSANELQIRLAPTRVANDMAEAYRTVARKYASQRAMSAGIGSDGGYTVPEGFVNNFERALLDFNGMRQVAEIMRTESGEDMPWPTSNDTGNKGRRIGENKPVVENTITVASITAKAYMYTSDEVLVSFKLLRDSAFDLGPIIGEMLGERIGRIQEEEFSDGVGGTMPHGIRVAATVGKTTAGPTAITADEVIDLSDSIDPAYLSGAVYMANKSIFNELRKLKDSEGQYLWQQSLQFGTPETFNGFPIVRNQNFPSAITANAITMTFGQHSKYKIRDVGTMRLKRLEERHAENDQIAFFAFMESDGFLLDAGTNPVKSLQQAP